MKLKEIFITHYAEFRKENHHSGDVVEDTIENLEDFLFYFNYFNLLRKVCEKLKNETTINITLNGDEIYLKFWRRL